MTKQTFKRYAISSAITFLTTFGIVMLADIDSITLESIKTGTVVGLVFIAIRAGLKAVLESLLINKNK